MQPENPLTLRQWERVADSSMADGRRDPPPWRSYFERGPGLEGNGRRIDPYTIPGWIGLGAIGVCRCAAAARSAKAADLCARSQSFQHALTPANALDLVL